VEFPEFSHEWEVLDIGDDRVVFNWSGGVQLISEKPPLYLLRLTDLMDGTRTKGEIFDEVKREFPSIDDASLENSFSTLIEKRMVHNGLVKGAIKHGFDESVVRRFEHSIHALRGYAKSEDEEFKFFERIRNAEVVIIGMGGNGSLLALYLAAAGIGKLVLVDGDVVEESNLVRQVLYTSLDAKQKKLKCLATAERIKEFSPFTQVEILEEFVSSKNCMQNLLSRKPSVAVLAADMPRMLVNRWFFKTCEELDVPGIGGLQNMLGPFFAPEEGGNPFDKLEERMSAKPGKEVFERIVMGLQVERPRPYPAMILGPAKLAYEQCYDIIGYITKAWQPRSLGQTILNKGARTTMSF